jgi:hypothetical protein
LTYAGYFDPHKRFWTDEDLPQAKAVYKRIADRLSAIGLKDSTIMDTYRVLTGNE